MVSQTRHLRQVCGKRKLYFKIANQRRINAHESTSVTLGKPKFQRVNGILKLRTMQPNPPGKKTKESSVKSQKSLQGPRKSTKETAIKSLFFFLNY